MNERLIPFASFYLEVAGVADADGVGGNTFVPEGMLLTGISHDLTLAGTPTASSIDIQDDGTDIETGLDISTGAMSEISPAVRIAAGSKMEMDLNLAGGSTPKAAGTVVLWGYVSE